MCPPLPFLYVFPEFYQQMLAKALAHHFEAKLLLLDIADFSIKVNYLESHSHLSCAFIFSCSEPNSFMG